MVLNLERLDSSVRKDDNLYLALKKCVESLAEMLSGYLLQTN